MTRDLTAERARELLDYDPDSGMLTWKPRSTPLGRVRAGGFAGTVRSDQRVALTIDGKNYKQHRVIWLLVHGRWPNDQIDHINGLPYDNRLANLRECTTCENRQNQAPGKRNKSGFMGVSWHARDRAWRAQIESSGVKRHLGTFESAEGAYAAYLDAKAELHTFQPTQRAALTAAQPADGKGEGA